MHCKSGVGRSATALAAFLLTKMRDHNDKEANLDYVIKLVQAGRPDAQLVNSKHSEALKAWYNEKATGIIKKTEIEEFIEKGLISLTDPF